MARVGFLGLGSMGQAMARRLLDAGHDVVVWNRSPEPRKALQDVGATAVETPAEALAADLSISMLANDHAADEVLRSENLPSHRIVHANMASVSPDMATTLSERFIEVGHAYVASPVLGRPHVAAEGGLNILAAGSTGDIERMKPLFDAMGQRTWPLGDHAPVANVIKIAVNYNIIHAIQALAESITIAATAGVKAEDFVEVLTETLFGGVVYSGYGSLIAERSYTPTAFSLDLGLKDLGLAESAAHSAGLNLPTSTVLRELFETALANPEIAHKDWSALAEVTLGQMKSEK